MFRLCNPFWDSLVCACVASFIHISASHWYLLISSVHMKMDKNGLLADSFFPSLYFSLTFFLFLSLALSLARSLCRTWFAALCALSLSHSRAFQLILCRLWWIVVRLQHTSALYRSAREHRLVEWLFTCASINITSEDAILHATKYLYYKYVCQTMPAPCHTSMTSEHALIAIYFDKLIIFDVYPSAACSLAKDF